MWISIRPDGPLFLRGHGEFDPSARGPFSFGRSLRWPRPGTIAGALASLAFEATGRKRERRENPWEDLSLVVDILEDAGIRGIWGPVLRHNGKLYAPIWAKGIKLVKISSLQRLSTLIEKGCFDIEDEISVPHQELVGIALMVRDDGQKKVKEGHLFIRVMTAFPPGSEFLIEIEGDPSVSLPAKVKFGGEGRMAMVAESEPPALPDGGSRSLLLSPAPLEGETKSMKVGEIDVIGLGFSVAVGRRRPMVRSVLEGAIFDIRCIRSAYDGALHHPYQSVLRRLGYGSFLTF